MINDNDGGSMSNNENTIKSVIKREYKQEVVCEEFVIRVRTRQYASRMKNIVQVVTMKKS